jgi:hypothetical protein
LRVDAAGSPGPPLSLRMPDLGPSFILKCYLIGWRLQM